MLNYNKVANFISCSQNRQNARNAIKTPMVDEMISAVRRAWNARARLV